MNKFFCFIILSIFRTFCYTFINAEILRSYSNLSPYTEIFKNTNNEDLIFSGGGINHNIVSLNRTSNTITTLAGNISSGFRDGPCTESLFNNPTQISAFYIREKIVGFFVIDVGNFCIRFIDLRGNNCTVSTALGNCTIQGATTGLGSVARLPILKTISMDSYRNYIYSSWNTNLIYRAVVRTISGKILLESFQIPILSYYQIRSTASIRNYDYSIFNTSAKEILLVADYNRLLSYYDGNIKRDFGYIGLGSGIITAIKQYGKYLFILKSQETSSSLYYLNSTGNFEKLNCTGQSNNIYDFEFIQNGSLFYSYSNSESVTVLNCKNFSFLFNDSYPFFSSTISRSKSKNISDTQSISKSKDRTNSASITLSFSSNTTQSLSLSNITSFSSTNTVRISITETNDLVTPTSLSKMRTGKISKTMSSSNSASTSVSNTPSDSISITNTNKKNNTSSREDSFTLTVDKTITTTKVIPRETLMSPLPSVTRRMETKTRTIFLEIKTETPKKIKTNNKLTNPTAITGVAISTLITSGALSVTSAITGTRTTAALKVISGDCTSSSETTIYENLLNTNPIVLGNTVVIFLLIITVSLVYWVFNRKKRGYEILINSHSIEIGFTIWCFLMPITAQQFKIYDLNSAYGIFSVIITGFYMFFPPIFIGFFLFRDEIIKDCISDEEKNKVLLKELLAETYEWKCRPALSPILQGYKQKYGFFIDIIVAYIFCFSFMLNDCKHIIIMMIVVNGIYFLLITCFQFLQPRCVVWGNAILIAGQLAAVIVSYQDYVDVNDQIEHIMYWSLIISTLLLLLPVIVGIFELIRNIGKKNKKDSDDYEKFKDDELSIINGEANISTTTEPHETSIGEIEEDKKSQNSHLIEKDDPPLIGIEKENKYKIINDTKDISDFL